MDKQPRRLPVFLNLAQIRFPIGAIASIAHRVSGVLLFIALPAYWRGIMWIGTLLWVGFTAAGLAWCIQYERTEPLDRP